MKIIASKNGKKTVKMSKKEWESIGKKAGWTGLFKNASKEEVINILKEISQLIENNKEMIQKLNYYDYSGKEQWEPLYNEVSVREYGKSIIQSLVKMIINCINAYKVAKQNGEDLRNLNSAIYNIADILYLFKFEGGDIPTFFGNTRLVEETKDIIDSCLSGNKTRGITDEEELNEIISKLSI